MYHGRKGGAARGFWNMATCSIPLGAVNSLGRQALYPLQQRAAPPDSPFPVLCSVFPVVLRNGKERDGRINREEESALLRCLYTLLLYCALPAALLRLLWRSRRNPAYRRRIAERFGFYPAAGAATPCIWLHTVSVGETRAAAPLVHALLEEGNWPVCITTTTPTGSQQVGALFGQQVRHWYFPFDLPGSVRRFLKHTRPVLAIFFETELWPNMIHACQRNRIPTLLANARLSASSARRYARCARLSRATFRRLDLVAAQSRADAQRLRTLGVAPQRLRVSGNLKYALTLSEQMRARARSLRAQWQAAGYEGIWIAGSTHEGEESIILEALGLLLPRLPRLLLILVPRHPERSTRVELLCHSRGFSCTRLSAYPGANSSAQVILGDTLGELLPLLGSGDLAFIGGSLVAHGGHNLLEPAAWGLPVLSGPALFNFPAIARELRRAGALVEVDSASQLSQEVLRLLQDEPARRRCGAAGLEVLRKNQGTTRQLLALIAQLLEARDGNTNTARQA